MRMPGGRVALTRATSLVAPLVLCLVVGACVRPPLADDCPALAEGDLVISELRGAQSGSYRQWIELYNPTDAAIPARGLRLEFTQLDGTSPVSFVVRDEDLTIEPGDFLVVGGGPPDEFPYIDYDYTPDFHSSTNVDNPRDLYGAATLDLVSCDVVLDHLIYMGLPTEGTLSLDGSAPPDAASNDDSRAGWCANTSPGDGPQTGIGLNGTPGEANPPCP